MRRIIIFLIRRRLRLREYEYFRFANQKTNNVYYFTPDSIKKINRNGIETHMDSSVSLNWLLNPECKILKVKKNWSK